MKRKKWIIFGIVFIVGIPLLLDWFIIGNSIPSNISNSDWISFFGGYIGAIIGASVSLIGIYATIRFTKEQLQMNKIQYEEQKRLNYMPILDCDIDSISDGVDEDALSMDVEYALNFKKDLHAITVEMDIWNIGIGAALNLKYGIKLSSINQDGVFWNPRMCLIRSQDLIKQKITFYIYCDQGTELTLVIFYEDVLGNRYNKCVDFVVNYQKDLNELVFFIKSQDKGNLYLNDDDKELYYVCQSLQL